MVQHLFGFIQGITAETDPKPQTPKKKFQCRRSANTRRILGDKPQKATVLKTRCKLLLDNGLQICYNDPLENGTEPRRDEMEPKKTVVEWFLVNRGYWRTGLYIRTVERGRRFGMIEIEPTGKLPKPRLFLRPDNVRPMEIK